MKKTLKEKEITFLFNGFFVKFISIVLIIIGLFLAFVIFLRGEENFSLLLSIAMIGCFVLGGFLSSILRTVDPNENHVLLFFGNYIGTIKKSGYFAVMPFTKTIKIPTKAINFDSSKIKVNDGKGNPIEISCIVVYRVVDTAKAQFEVDNYREFVEMQTESSLRNLASKYPYDAQGAEESLLKNPDAIGEELQKQIQSQLDLAGIEIIEAKLNHLSYASEIASAMLQRQQAEAVVIARHKIVEGATKTAQEAIAKIESSGIKLTAERKAEMINNLMVAIVSDRPAQPVINTSLSSKDSK